MVISYSKVKAQKETHIFVNFSNSYILECTCRLFGAYFIPGKVGRIRNRSNRSLGYRC